jgi:hypothetical protein
MAWLATSRRVMKCFWHFMTKNRFALVHRKSIHGQKFDSGTVFVFFESFVYTLFSATKEIRAWISLCTVAGEVTNGLPFPMMVVDDTKAMMAVVVLQRPSLFYYYYLRLEGGMTNTLFLQIF